MSKVCRVSDGLNILREATRNGVFDRIAKDIKLSIAVDGNTKCNVKM